MEGTNDDLKPVWSEGAQLQKAITDAGGKVIAESIAALEKLLTANTLVWSAVATALERHNRKPIRDDGTVRLKFAYACTFIHGMNLQVKTIVEGYYIQAYNLLKQEMETVAALEECLSGQRQERRAPNVKHLKFGIKRLYDMANDAAHVSVKDVLFAVYGRDEIAAGTMSLIPKLIEIAARQLLGCHIVLAIQFAACLDRLFLGLYGEGLSEQVRKALTSAGQLLVEEGVLEAKSA